MTSQRGSRDNDYLTTASDQQITALMDAFARRFADAFEGQLFVPRPLVPKDKEPLPLPMQSFLIDVPGLLAPDERPTMEVKIEFQREAELPPTDLITAESFAVGQTFPARVPRVPYQVGLKLLALTTPPVGIPEKRQGQLPQQALGS